MGGVRPEAGSGWKEVVPRRPLRANSPGEEFGANSSCVFVRIHNDFCCSFLVIKDAKT